MFLLILWLAPQNIIRILDWVSSKRNAHSLLLSPNRVNAGALLTKVHNNGNKVSIHRNSTITHTQTHTNTHIRTHTHIYNYFPKYWLLESTKNICRSNQLKQRPETYGSNKHRNTNQQTTEQQRGPPRRNKQESNQTTIIVPDTQERDDATSKDQHFFIPRPQSKRLERGKVTPKTWKTIDFLRRGLKFTPTTKPNTIELKRDIQEFTSKLRLTEFFHSENLDSSQETRKSVSDPLVKYKSNFYPPRNRNKFLDK